MGGTSSFMCMYPRILTTPRRSLGHTPCLRVQGTHTSPPALGLAETLTFSTLPAKNRATLPGELLASKQRHSHGVSPTRDELLVLPAEKGLFQAPSANLDCCQAPLAMIPTVPTASSMQTSPARTPLLTGLPALSPSSLPGAPLLLPSLLSQQLPFMFSWHPQKVPLSPGS